MSLTYSLDTSTITLVVCGRGLQDGDDSYDECKTWTIHPAQLWCSAGSPTSTPRPIAPTMRTLAAAIRRMDSRPYTASCLLCKSSSMSILTGALYAPLVA